MVLSIGKNIFSQNIFKISPGDDSYLIFKGNREIPTDSDSKGSYNITKKPNTIADDAAVGTITWENLNNALLEDGNSATNLHAGGSQSHYLKATNFGFAIPAGATINGILISIKREGNTEKDVDVKIVKSDGTIGATDKADTSIFWPSVLIWKDYGGSNDLWGETWTTGNINDSDFGVVITETSGPEGGTAKIDNIKTTIYYTLN
ncbi:MAG: hypothetical protein WC711_04215 [Candidatus Staskawiczbacteria bacterium]|jgi:hypothetical protein